MTDLVVSSEIQTLLQLALLIATVQLNLQQMHQFMICIIVENAKFKPIFKKKNVQSLSSSSWKPTLVMCSEPGRIASKDRWNQINNFAVFINLPIPFQTCFGRILLNVQTIPWQHNTSPPKMTQKISPKMTTKFDPKKRSPLIHVHKAQDSAEINIIRYVKRVKTEFFSSNSV